MKIENNKKGAVLLTEHVKHTFEPVYNSESRILVLGTFPSVKSRENDFYYGNPQNRFWKVISGVLGCETPHTVEQKKQMLLDAGIAIWDVIESCDIIGSSDSSIQNVIPNKLDTLIANSAVTAIYANGSKAASLYEKYSIRETGMEIKCLPSTSPANAAYSLERLIEHWKIIIGRA